MDNETIPYEQLEAHASAMREAAGVRKAMYQQMAREAIDSVSEEAESDDVPVVQVREPDQSLIANDRPAPRPEGRSIPIDAPIEDHMNNTATRTRPEFNKPLPNDVSFAELLDIPESRRNLNLGRYLRGRITGNWKGAEMEHRAMQEDTAGEGGNLLPVVYSSQVVDLARNATQVINAGARIVPMSARQVILPKWTGDPTVAWRAEEGAVGTSDATVDKITFTARSLAGYTTLSRELIEDTDVSGLLGNAYAQAVAHAWDLAALYGSGVAPNPAGIKNNAAVTDDAPLATNGALFSYDYLMDAVGSVRARNENVTAALMAPRSMLTLGKEKDGTSGAYRVRPPYLDGVKLLETGQIPVNETEGTSSGICSSLFVGDFSQLLIGVRTNFGVNVYEQPSFATGQVVMVAWMRCDVQVGRGGAFAVRTGLKTS